MKHLKDKPETNVKVDEKRLTFAWQLLIDADGGSFRTGATIAHSPVTDVDIKCVVQTFQRQHPFMAACNIHELAFLAVCYYEGAYYESLDVTKYWTESYDATLREKYRKEGGELE